MWGGGNSLNTIRIPSREQWINIIKSDMNGTVDASSITNRASRWNYFSDGSYKMPDYTTTQNNKNYNCYSSMYYIMNNIGNLAFSYISKDSLIGSIDTGFGSNYHYISSFRPIIEC